MHIISVRKGQLLMKLRKLTFIEEKNLDSYFALYTKINSTRKGQRSRRNYEHTLRKRH